MRDVQKISKDVHGTHTVSSSSKNLSSGDWNYSIPSLLGGALCVVQKRFVVKGSTVLLKSQNRKQKVFCGFHGIPWNTCASNLFFAKLQLKQKILPTQLRPQNVQKKQPFWWIHVWPFMVTENFGFCCYETFRILVIKGGSILSPNLALYIISIFIHLLPWFGASMLPVYHHRCRWGIPRIWWPIGTIRKKGPPISPSVKHLEFEWWLHSCFKKRSGSIWELVHEISLMEEILYHLTCMKPCKSWYIYIYLPYQLVQDFFPSTVPLTSCDPINLIVMIKFEMWSTWVVEGITPASIHQIYIYIYHTSHYTYILYEYNYSRL